MKAIKHSVPCEVNQRAIIALSGECKHVPFVLEQFKILNAVGISRLLLLDPTIRHA